MKIKRFLYDIKQHIHRANTYVALANSGMILFIFLGALGIDIKGNFGFIFAGGLFLLLLVGFVDIKLLRGYQEEQSIWFNRNPQLVEMKKDIEEIKEMCVKQRKGKQ